MLRSMTGFAQVQRQEPPYAVLVRLKAWNHRFLDLHLRLGAELGPLEAQIRSLLRERVRRGHVEVTVQVESSEKPALEVNGEWVRSYVELFNALRREHGIAAEPDLMAILRMPGVVRVGERMKAGADDSRLARAVEAAVGQALAELERMRGAEGKMLEQELRGRVVAVRATVEQVAEASESARSVSFARLRARLEELLGEIPLDETRLAQEAAYLAERSDVSEEVARLRSHVEQFLNLLGDEGEVGRRLDFLLQEMNRETNALLSKSPAFDSGGLEMTRMALEIKAEIERLREQVQNVE
ncbi:MAG: YicC/YloC family endoribonuclease [Terriglobia bacterium]